MADVFPSSPPPIQINSNTTLEDVINATIFSEEPSRPIVASSPDISPAELRFDECLESLLDSCSSPEKKPSSDELLSSLYSALQEPGNTKSSLDDVNIQPANPIKPPASTNFVISALQSALISEGSTNATPSLLIRSMQPVMSTASRESLLLHRMDLISSVYLCQVNELSSFFKYQSSLVETERFCALHENINQPDNVKNHLNHYYDNILHSIINRVESSITFLEKSLPQIPAQAVPPTSNTHVNLRTRPSLTQKAIHLMEQWYYSHLDHPYPPQHITCQLAIRGGITEEQVKKWFSNKRNRSRKNSGGVSKRRPRQSFVPRSVPYFM